jgi:hypothetical protein
VENSQRSLNFLSRTEDWWASVLLIHWTWLLFRPSFLMKIILDVLGCNIWNSIVSKGFRFLTCPQFCGICSYERSGTVITWCNPETLVTSVYIDYTSCTGNNHCSIILIPETVELLEHSVDLYISVCIIGRVSSVSRLYRDSCRASFLTESRDLRCALYYRISLGTLLNLLNRPVVTYLDSVQYCGNLMR